MAAPYLVTVNEKKSFTVGFSERGTDEGRVNGKPFRLDVWREGDGRMHIIRNNRCYSVDLGPYDLKTKTFTVVVNGNRFTAVAEDRYDTLLRAMGLDAAYGSKANDVRAPMPGKVLNVMVKTGQEVKINDPLVVLEAMKMENVIKAPCDAVVKKVGVEKGATVEKNALLVDFE